AISHPSIALILCPGDGDHESFPVKDLNPIEPIWGDLWLELQRALANISVEALSKYIDTMPERCAAVIAEKRWTYQILTLKVDKNRTHCI
uniref:Uncharacterized protein n=1 Tax=Mola mola TaxID=94237 RepID=A0A3Q3XG71_MOLML